VDAASNAIENFSVALQAQEKNVPCNGAETPNPLTKSLLLKTSSADPQSLIRRLPSRKALLAAENAPLK
jgi:hypothetical protein